MLGQPCSKRRQTLDTLTVPVIPELTVATMNQLISDVGVTCLLESIAKDGTGSGVAQH